MLLTPTIASQPLNIKELSELLAKYTEEFNTLYFESAHPKELLLLKKKILSIKKILKSHTVLLR